MLTLPGLMSSNLRSCADPNFGSREGTPHLHNAYLLNPCKFGTILRFSR
jgi:hypothetical protein